MDSQSRQTASLYINNLLLSRGLLRNGAPIQFAKPEEAEGGVNATMAQIMNLVHDLILRRDREADTLSTLSQTLQTLRTSSAQHTQTTTLLETRTSDLDRQLAIVGAQERSARATLRSAETRNRALREEMARLKGTVAQIRAQCATDVRRRDGEIQRLKKHLEGRRGKDGNGGQVGVVVVTPGINKMQQGYKNGEAETALESPVYSLKQETTEFLTQLSQGLSDENDALIGLVKGTLATLRSLQGLPIDTDQEGELGCILEGAENSNGFMNGPSSYEALATGTEEVLEHLRGLLTNPSFVPLEEVEMREEEIQRLREGWEKMAVRWKEAVALMDGWKKRMVDTGDTINLEDLKLGLKLGSGIPSAQEARQSPLKQPEKSTGFDDSDLPQNLRDSHERDIHEDSSSVEVDEEDVDVIASSRALDERSANARPSPSTRKVSFPSIPEENTQTLENEDDLSLLDFSTHKAPQSTPLKPKSRIPQQTNQKTLSPARTVAQKLQRAQAEAEEARNREEKRSHRQATSKKGVTKKLKGSRRRSTLSPEELENLMGVA